VLPYPALHASHGGIWIAQGGETRGIGRGEAIRIAADTPVIMLNAALIGQRLGYADLSGLDLLELYAFLRPAQFAVPTPKGIARNRNGATAASSVGTSSPVTRAIPLGVGTANCAGRRKA
jgi:hypothetical protein